METKKTKTITAEATNSPKGNRVWKVYVQGSRSKKNASYCTSAKKAMRFAFILKQRTGLYITKEALAFLMEEHAKTKEQQTGAEASA